VESVTPYNSQKKLTPKLVAALARLAKGQAAEKKDEGAVISLETFNPSGISPAAELVTSLGGQVKTRTGRHLTATLPWNQITALALSEDIVSLDRVEPYRLFNDRAAGVVGAIDHWRGGLDGTGQVVAVADTGLE